MFRNIYYDRYNRLIHLWETEGEKRYHRKISFVPYVFVKNMDSNSEIKSIFGEGVKKKTFSTFNDYKEFCDNILSEKDDKNQNIYENNVKPEIQFLTERYFHIPDSEMKAVPLRINVLDIEVFSEKPDKDKVFNIRIKGSIETELYNYNQYIDKLLDKEAEYFDSDSKSFKSATKEIYTIKGGFPDPEKAEWPISLISCYDSFLNKVYTFGLNDYSGELDNEKWFIYTKLDSEKELIETFFEFMSENIPDVMTGWYNLRIWYAIYY